MKTQTKTYRAATRYGIELPTSVGLGSQSVEEDVVGEPGEEVDVFERVQKMQLEAEIRRRIAEERMEEEEDELKRFGLELFDAEVSTFAPVDNIPVPEGYRLGVGDELRVMLIGKEQGDFPLLIGRDGSVTLPKLGRVVLSGLTFPEAKN